MTQAQKTQSCSYFYSFPFCARSQSSWLTCHNTHFFFREMSGLVVSDCFCQHQENLSKRTNLYSTLHRESSTLSSARTTASQNLRQYLVFQLFGSGKSTLGVIVLVHSGGRSLTALSSLADKHTITPTPSENIIDLDIKGIVRL